MEELLGNALIGAIGSSPVALVLVWRLRVADAAATRAAEATTQAIRAVDDRYDALEQRFADMVEEHTKWFRGLLAGKKMEN